MASTNAEARDVLSEFITTTWNAATSSALLLYDNLDERRPDSPILHGRLTIQFNAGTKASLGGATARHRRSGILSVQIFVRMGTATTEADDAATAIVEALENVGPATLENIWLRDIGAKDIGPDGTYFQVNVDADFIYDRVA